MNTDGAEIANLALDDGELFDVSFYKHPPWRRVISQFREIFNKFHVRVEQNREESERNRSDSLNLSNICLEASQSYINAIQNELDLLDENDETETARDLKIHLQIWKLCQIIFIKSSPSGALLNDLQEWYKSTNNIDPLIQNFFKSNQQNSSKFSQHPNYWIIILMSVAQGRIDTARHLLGLHDLAKTSSEFKAVDELLRTMPTFQSLSHLSMFEFKTKWEFWQKKCIQVLNSQEFTIRHLETICKMFCAVEKTFLEHKELFQSWYYMMISYVSYANPTFNISDLHHYLSSGANMNEFALEEFDLLIYSIFDFDVDSVIKYGTKLLSSNLFTAHLLDILYLNGKLQLNKHELSSAIGIPMSNLDLETNNSNQNADIVHEEHLIAYSEQLMSLALASPTSFSILETAINYLLKCCNLEPNRGINLVEAYLDKIALTEMSELDANKLFHLAYKLGLDDVAYQIGRVMQMRSFKANQYGTALGWNVRIKDATFGNLLAEKILDDYFEESNPSLLELVENLSKEVIYCDRLIFLSKFREYLQLTEEFSSSNHQHHQRTTAEEKQKQLADFKKAATLITELFGERGLVPFKYKRRLIFKTSFLLERGVFNEEQLVSLLRVIQNFENRLDYFYDGNYKATFLKMRPDLMEYYSSLDKESVGGGGGNSKCTIDNYNQDEWRKLQIQISQRLAEEFVKKPINLDSF